MMYHRNRALWHYWSPRWVLFSVYGRKVSHTHILVPLLSRRTSISGAAAMASSSAACTLCTYRLRISSCPSRRSRAWSSVLNYVLPLRAAARYPMKTQETVHLSQADRVGLVISRPPAWLTNGWSPALGLRPWSPGKGPVGRSFAGPHQPAGTPPNIWGDTLDEMPLLLEGIFNTSIVFLRMLVFHPIQHVHRVCSPSHILNQKLILWLLVTNDFTKVANFSDHAQIIGKWSLDQS